MSVQSQVLCGDGAGVDYVQFSTERLLLGVIALNIGLFVAYLCMAFLHELV